MTNHVNDNGDGSAKRQKISHEKLKKSILLNGFDMFTPSHLSFGQWRRPDDRSKDKRRDLTYWTNLAQILERGDITALFLADTYGQHDVYKGNAEPTFRTACQYPMGDPSIPVTAMAAVTKNLSFAITTSTSYESPFVVAKRFSTLDHLTKGRFGWNIVTSFKKSGAAAVGLPLIEHDKRYEIADDYLRCMYKIWESSWADDALKEDAENEVYVDFERVRWIQHETGVYKINAPHVLDPSPQRTPFLFQAGTSSAGMTFAATHAEGVFVSAPSPHILAPRVANIRKEAAALGRDPQSVKIFAVITPVIGRTDEEAQIKYQEALKYASAEGGLAFFSSNAGIDLSQYDLDKEITPEDVSVDGRVHSLVNSLKYHGNDIPAWTPRNIGKAVSLGANGPVPVGTAAKIADVLEEWMEIADLDGFNVGYVTSPGSFEDLVDLLVPELRLRGRYPEKVVGATLRERVFGVGQSKLRDDHVGSTYKYDNYQST
ncbi:putative dibenzothiophene desulfurization enzyme A [Cucurbitaria berberidis CBS 394.84]|uniref:Dibenzothiophene desulfurization enzyme A n=1 Tax=Cucurbitaria berberidis CBS 394.84 TaxID=1168544 RepID=A0A9P4GMG1_9PLEO|nr:putative dibenzothiophene desulfurization enzyme A [Cucurbitaria berberidis CBS 394.84]KAF1847902.1 putative dibenzothiophene desulfurization enzyme A [Cucurbitaria berberidis CBS 394.84]